VDNKDTTTNSEDEFKHCTIVHSPPKPLEGYTILYKAFASILPLDSTSLFPDDESLNISTLSSSHRGDFNGLHSAVYLTPQRQTADLFVNTFLSAVLSSQLSSSAFPSLMLFLLHWIRKRYSFPSNGNNFSGTVVEKHIFLHIYSILKLRKW
jgi:hypothetical protein